MTAAVYSARTPLDWKTPLTALDTAIALELGSGRSNNGGYLFFIQNARHHLATVGAKYGGKDPGQPATGLWGKFSVELRRNEQSWSPKVNEWQAGFEAFNSRWGTADLAARYAEELELDARRDQHLLGRRVPIRAGVETLLLPELPTPFRSFGYVAPSGSDPVPSIATDPVVDGERVLYGSMDAALLGTGQTVLSGLAIPTVTGTLDVTLDCVPLAEHADYTVTGDHELTLAAPGLEGQTVVAGVRGTEVCRVTTKLRGLLGSFVQLAVVRAPTALSTRFMLSARLGPYVEALGEGQLDRATQRATFPVLSNSALLASITPLALGRPADAQLSVAGASEPVLPWLPMVGARGDLFGYMLNRLQYAQGYASCPALLGRILESELRAVTGMRDREPRVPVPEGLLKIEASVQTAIRDAQAAVDYITWVRANRP